MSPFYPCSSGRQSSASSRARTSDVAPSVVATAQQIFNNHKGEQWKHISNFSRVQWTTHFQISSSAVNLKVLLASDDNDLVHVCDHDPGLEEQGQVHDDVLVAGGRALDRLPDHLLVDLGVGDPVQLLTLLLILEERRNA